jgi:hypothetical protein
VIQFLERMQESLRGEGKLGLRLRVMFCLGLLTNALGCMFAYATAHKMIGTVVLIGFFLPIINFSISMIFLDAKTFRERVYIMLVNSLALSLAAGAVATFYG